ncbi:TetR/AcrR family transcriptional regulator [Streptomyces sp. HM190]|uniref:TetR/AcrR family transcriptional regulator n=1 Tax=Streptomyces sp. HM190 TaxID=2695266 RepID=UPI00135A5FF0|nr:TetR/AcrR family transcriptional regulator [Streptomyces sp. HM190]
MANQTPAPSAGLRETKKLETRQLISAHATRLFLAQGFERTTIAEIAAAARVAKKTVTNYFPRKEDLALDHQEEFATSLARAVDARRPGESALAALRRAFADSVASRDRIAGFSGRESARMIADSPTLSACVRGLHDQRARHLARSLAEATGTDADDITVRAAAELLGAAHRTLFHRVQELTLAGHPDERIARTLTTEAARVFDLLEPALADYATA